MGLDHTIKGDPLVAKKVPVAPPLPPQATTTHHIRGLEFGSSLEGGHSYCGCTHTRDLCDRLFDEAYCADVSIKTDNGGVIYAHSNILGLASPVMKSVLKKPGSKRHKQSFSIHGITPDAVRVFIRFLYSSCYEQQDMEEYALHLLVLSHVFVIPHLKRLCERHLEQGLLNTDNAVDIFQLALLCDAPRLSFICHRRILRNFKSVTETEGWMVMKNSHPSLEKELLVSKIYEEAIQKERRRKLQDKKTYLQLYEAMRALVHIFRDGCQTIGPRDKLLKDDRAACNFEDCKGLELLVRHFASCKLRVPGSCARCKRMWQLLELHSRLCATSDVCRVPLCRNFKERMSKQSKKDEMKWRMLVRNMLRAKSISGGISNFTSIRQEEAKLLVMRCK